MALRTRLLAIVEGTRYGTVKRNLHIPGLFVQIELSLSQWAFFLFLSFRISLVCWVQVLVFDLITDWRQEICFHLDWFFAAYFVFEEQTVRFFNQNRIILFVTNYRTLPHTVSSFEPDARVLKTSFVGIWFGFGNHVRSHDRHCKTAPKCCKRSSHSFLERHCQIRRQDVDEAQGRIQDWGRGGAYQSKTAKSWRLMIHMTCLMNVRSDV